MNKVRIASILVSVLSAALLASCSGGGGGAAGGGGIAGTAPTANFNASPRIAIMGNMVTFTDASTGSPKTWSWDFNNDGTEDSSEQNPSFMYPGPGTYTVRLTAGNVYGAKTEIKSDYIVVHPQLVADFTATPLNVPAGQPVQFTDATIGGPAEWQWDFNGDLIVDSFQQNPSHTFLTPGVYDIRLSVKNIAHPNVVTIFKNGYITVTPPAGVVVDIDVDANRDGVVSAGTDDDDGEEVWSAAKGAVFYFNLDDDDGDEVEDYKDSVSENSDLNDLSRIIVRQCTALSGGGTVTVNVSIGAQARIRIFRNVTGTWISAYSTGPSFTIQAAALAAGDVELGIEARQRISTNWNGMVTLSLEIRDAANVQLGTDEVVLRMAPPLVSTNLWNTTQLHIVEIPTAAGSTNNLAARVTMSGICTAAGIQYREVPGALYSYDRWLQDSSEAAVVQLPVNGAPRRVIDQVIQLARVRPVDTWCFDELLGPDFDFLARFFSSPTPTSSHNYGGNFEVVPPYAGKPWGQVLFGGGTGPLLGTTTDITDNMDQRYKDYFDIAGAQGPHVEITSEWLAVGHVDEYTMFIPAPNTARGWVCLIASPQRAIEVLQATQGAGQGGATIFTGRSGWQTTVSAILSDPAAMTLQQQAQVRINQGRDQIKAATGLLDADFIHLPVLFEYVGGNWVAAWNPGVVNLVCMPVPSGTTYLAVPDPEGPHINGVDQWKLDIENKLAPLDTAAKPYNIQYVDVFWSYHDLLGEIHCSSNFVRTPPADDWWDK